MCIETISIQLLLDIADFIYIAVDVNQKVTLVNKKGCEILGYSEDEIIGKDWFDNFLPKGVAKEIKSSFIKRIDEKEEFELAKSYSILTKEGEERLISWQSTFYIDKEGNLSGVLCSGEDITEKRKMEVELEKERKTTKQYLEIANVVLIAIDANENVTLVNKKGCELLGYEHEEIIGKNWFDNFLPKRICNKTKEVFKKIMNDEIAQSEYYENLLLTKDGEEKLIAWDNTDIRDEEGRIIGTLSSGRDVTEKRQAEEELNESERLSNIILNHAFQLTGILDLEGRLLKINQTALDFAGLKDEDAIGKLIWDTYWWSHSEEERIRLRKNIKRASKGKIIQDEITNIDKNGYIRTMDFSVKPITDNRSNVTSLIIEGQDITEKKMVYSNLLKSEHKFRSIFNHSNDGYILKTVEGIILEANPRFLEMFGYESSEVSSEVISNNTMFINTFETKEEHNRRGKEIEKKGYAMFETLAKKKDGSIFPMEANAVKLLLGSEEVVFVIFRDITERKEIEEKIKSSEALYRALFDNTGTGMMLLEEDFTITLVNDLLIEKSGISQEEFIGKKWTEFVQKEERENITKAVKRMSIDFIPPLAFETSDFNIFGENKTLLVTIGIIPETKQQIASIIDRTEQKKLEKELSVSEERYRELFNKMSDGVVVLEAVNNGKNFLIKDYNRAGEEIDNRKREQVVGKLLSEAFPGSEEGGFTAQMRRVWESGETERLLLSFYQDDIISGWRKNHTYRLPSKEVVCVYDDVSKEQQYLKQLETSEEKFRMIFENAYDGISIHEIDGTIIDMNKSSLDRYGYEKSEMVGKKVSDLDTYVDPKFVENMLQNIVKEKHLTVETKAKRKDGTLFHQELSLNLVNLSDKQLIFGISRNITKRIEAEKELKSSEERLRNLFNNIPLAISINSSEGKLIDVNPSYLKLFGYSNKEECISAPFANRWFKIGDRERLYDSLHQKNFVRNFEAKRYRKDGSEFWGAITAIAQLDTSGERSYFKTHRDITAEKQKEEELKRQTMRYYLEESHLYLSEEERPYISKEAFSDLLRVGYNGLVLSRLTETEWKKDINYEFDFFRIAEKGHLKTISSELSKIEQLIEELPNKHVIVIDRLDYLIAKNGFETTLFFIFRLMDIAYLSNHIIIVTLDPATINEKESRSLRKEMRMIKSLAEATLPEELIEILEFVHKRNITGNKPSYTDIVEAFNISRPTVRKRIKDLISDDYTYELTKGRSKVLGITAKGKAIFD
jgi:PAS domain S-box-containing protein